MREGGGETSVSVFTLRLRPPPDLHTADEERSSYYELFLPSFLPSFWLHVQTSKVKSAAAAAAALGNGAEKIIFRYFPTQGNEERRLCRPKLRPTTTRSACQGAPVGKVARIAFQLRRGKPGNVDSVFEGREAVVCCLLIDFY